MVEKTEKTHEHDYYWYLENGLNERGWKCCECEDKPGEPPGFSPELDREFVGRKAHDILLQLNMKDALFNGMMAGSTGESMVWEATERAKETGFYDQNSLVVSLLQHRDNSHAEFWKKVSDGILAGEDPRDRCDCGALSTISSAGGGEKNKYWCKDCYRTDPKGLGKFCE